VRYIYSQTMLNYLSIFLMNVTISLYKMELVICMCGHKDGY